MEGRDVSLLLLKLSMAWHNASLLLELVFRKKDPPVRAARLVRRNMYFLYHRLFHSLYDVGEFRGTPVPRALPLFDEDNFGARVWQLASRPRACTLVDEQVAALRALVDDSDALLDFVVRRQRRIFARWSSMALDEELQRIGRMRLAMETAFK